MNEEMKKNQEIDEELLENVSGGNLGTGGGRCIHCGGRIIYGFNEKTGKMDLPRCISCGK